MTAGNVVQYLVVFTACTYSEHQSCMHSAMSEEGCDMKARLCYTCTHE